MVLLATPIVDWSAMWKICLVALAAGAGVVVAFGFLLLGLKLANGARTGGSRLGGYTLSALCGVLCLGVIAVGVYAMTKKPKSKPAKPKSAAALVIPAAPAGRPLAEPRGA
jgi:hypothetical protein